VASSTEEGLCSPRDGPLEVLIAELLPEDPRSAGKNAVQAPQWARIWWRVGLFTGAIALLWALLYVGFWITSLQRASAPRRSF
jgi:hypothetical protein